MTLNKNGTGAKSTALQLKMKFWDREGGGITWKLLFSVAKEV